MCERDAGAMRENWAETEVLNHPSFLNFLKTKAVFTGAVYSMLCELSSEATMFLRCSSLLIHLTATAKNFAIITWKNDDTNLASIRIENDMKTYHGFWPPVKN